MEYIIVQAGGRGIRMKGLTRNKPKALVPVGNLPMIMHLFRRFPEKKFIVIGDYKFDVLKRYLSAFARSDYQLVCASGHSGTCAGMEKALTYVPDGRRFMIIWCDLVLPEDHEIPETENNIIGLSKDFPCRWKYQNGIFSEETSTEYGVAGYFIFKDKSFLAGVPQDGEFVRWLKDSGCRFEEQVLYHVHEYGLYSEWNKLPALKCRPFNSIVEKDGRIYKKAADEQGEALAVRETAWYRKMHEKQFSGIPQIYGFEPLIMEKIDGKNIYEYADVSLERKKEILKQVIGILKQVHNLGSIPADDNSYRIAYLDKTFTRLEKVRELVPFAGQKAVRVNGRLCRNVFFHWQRLEKMVMKYLPKEFCLIHGDCTFSNIMLRNGEVPVLIDPRGYFGMTEYYGDAAYDWVKLYYSLVSNYDQFNLKRFQLYIEENGVTVQTDSSQWEELEDCFFELLDGEVTKAQMMILLAITWLSLTTYAWEDYDSICGAFYYGLYYFEEALRMETAYDYFAENMAVIENALKTVKADEYGRLLDECEAVIRHKSGKIIVSGLGKNVPICDKFVGTMNSLGFRAGFLHTNSAVHGDMGMVHPGDLVIILTKSGATAESVYLADLLEQREGVCLWLLSFEKHSILADRMQRKLIVAMEHEGDLWNVLPNNSTTLNLIILQSVAIELSRRLNLSLEKDFLPNHPGGAIGERFRNEK